MKSNMVVTLLIVLLTVWAAALPAQAALPTVDAARQAFLSPSATARPRTWWHWLNGRVTEADITADLEAMAEAGLGGAQIFEWGKMPGACGPVAFASSNWISKVAFAAKEAKRLGLVLGAHNCSGCSSSGGPWVDEAHAMKRLKVTVYPASAKINPPSRTVAVVPFNLPQKRLANGRYAAITNLAYKAYVESDWENGWRVMTSEVAPAFCVQSGGASTATLLVEWEPMTTKNNPATPSGEGFETDKFSKEATRLHFAAYPAKLKGLVSELLIDSYEVGPQNWTVGFEKEFARRRGYAMDRWFPVFAGFIVESAAASERFLTDFRRTCSELFCENYADEMKRLANEHGMILMAQNYGDCPADAIDYGRAVDVPMSEFWFRRPPAAPGPGYARLAACAASSNGVSIVASEAFTAQPDDAERPWGPKELKPFADAAFAGGVNSLYLHTWVLREGLTRPKLLRWGTMFSPELPWWKTEAKPFFRYLSRCQAVLRLGERVAADWGWMREGDERDFVTQGGKPFAVTHRRLRDGDVYFLAPSVRKEGTVCARFGAATERAEIWDPETGVASEASVANGELDVPLDRSTFVVFRSCAPTPLSGTASWGGRRPHKALVNPCTPRQTANILSLRGDWEFVALHHWPRRNASFGKRFALEKDWPATRRIHVPGCWEAQGVGETNQWGKSWGCYWDAGWKHIRHKHLGEGWYRKTVRIPSEWRDKRVWIALGGVNAQGWVWVNGSEVAWIDDWCGTYRYDITDLVRPGEETSVVIEADNSVPSKKGCFNYVHKWGGLYRDVELQATADCWIEDAWVKAAPGDVPKPELHVELGGVTNGVVQTVRYSDTSFAWWSPDDPRLFTCTIELHRDGRLLERRTERFGLKRMEVRGEKFYLNGQPIFLRGFGDDAVYPLTGISPADRDYHRRHLEKAKRAGFNFVRLHTHCEVPEYFEAADEVGILIEAELPYYSDMPTDNFSFDPLREARELHGHYRRHPSYAVTSGCNEGSFGTYLSREFYRTVKALDPDRLVIETDSNNPAYNLPDNSDYASGPITTWEKGSYAPGRPFVCHEYLNLCVKLPATLETQFTGAWMPPETHARRDAFLARFGLDRDWGDRLQLAQHKLQAIWQKRGLCAAHDDPHCAGYCFWTIVDVCVKTAEGDDHPYSAQGLFDPFWNDKPGGMTAEEFAVHNAWGRGRPHLIGDGIGVGAPSPPQSGILPPYSVAAGAHDSSDRFAAPSAIDMPPHAPPPHAVRVKPGDVAVVVDDLAQAERLYAQGKSVLFVGGLTENGTNLPLNVSLGWWAMGTQVGTALKAHPVWGEFRHDGCLDERFFRIVKKGAPLPLAGFSKDDLVMVGEGGEACFCNLAVKSDGKAKMVFAWGLDVLADLPESVQLYNGFINYLRGDGALAVARKERINQ